MFLIRAITVLLALPFLWIGRLLSSLRLPLGLPLLRTAWAVSGDGAIGRIALNQSRQQMGLGAARGLAERWIENRPRPEIAAYAGLMALEQRQPEAARRHLHRARQLGDDPAGMIELLELLLAAEEDDPQVLREVASGLAARRDLSPVVSKLVHSELLWDAMLAGRLDEARARATHILAVEDAPAAEIALWAIARRDRNALAADGHLRRAAKMHPDQRLYYMLLGALAIGSADEAGEMLTALRERNAGLARSAERVLAERGGAR